MPAQYCSVEEFDAIYARLDAAGMANPNEFVELPGITVRFPGTEALSRLDPFSPAYRDAALDLYLRIRAGRGESYDATRDEAAPLTYTDDAFCAIPPWGFRDTSLVAQFLHSYASVFDAMGLGANDPARIIEYGCGSGQMILMLSRMRFDAHGVDIDAGAVRTVRRQAEAMHLPLKVEQAPFGQGFAGETFDRILFFEAFHHAFDFLDLLRDLPARLNPGGRLILAGEPVFQQPPPAVPYPWGPRLDVLSMFCMRRHGWMELGFGQDFFMAALRRHGWLAEFRPSAATDRAHVFVAARPTEEELEGRWSFRPGDREPPVGRLDAAEWSVPEGAHRWTAAPRVRIALPQASGRRVDLRLAVMNAFPGRKRVLLSSGGARREVVVPASSTAELELPAADGPALMVETELWSPATAIRGSADTRRLGLAVREIRSVPTGG